MKTFFIGPLFLFLPFVSFAQTENEGSVGVSQVYISPKSGTFEVGSVFEAQVFLDSKGNSVNAVDLEMNFDPKKVQIVKPSGGKSIFGIWIEPPTYDNKTGKLKMSGVIPEGIVASSGLLASVSFKVIETGESSVRVSDESSVYLNDGSGTEKPLPTSSAYFTLKNPISGDFFVESISHPFSDNWYNNNNPRFSWDGSQDAEGYSFLIDSNPATSPSNEILITEKTKSFSDLQDGIWYFHLKEKVDGVWSDTFHKQIKIDTTSPEEFTPNIDKIIGRDTGEYIVSFDTEDDGSGIAYYEIGILSDNRAKNSLPVFIQTESPHFLPLIDGEDVRIIVKAFDNAGNVREGFTSLKSNQTKLYIFLGGSILILILVAHYLYGHHMLGRIKKAYGFFKEISKPKA